MLLMNERGQEEAPFELIVAVIIMGFVLIVGFLAMQQIQKDICLQKINKQIGDFRINMENVVTKKGSVSILLDFPNECYPDEKEEFRIVHIDDKYLCENYCEGMRQDCMVLSYRNPVRGLRECINIPPETNFPTEAGAMACPEMDNYELQDLMVDIPQGKYMLLNKSITGSNPTICAYLRKGV